MTPDLTIAQARRIQLRSQGFGGIRGHGPAAVRAVLDRVAQFQLDSVSVVQRAHYLPLFSRLGPYRPELLDRAWADRQLFEYWGHAACLVDTQLLAAMGHRMQARAARPDRREATVLAEHPDLAEQILTEVAERGPLTQRELASFQPAERTDWGWNWSTAKVVAERLFDTGALAVHSRNTQFEKRFDLPERVHGPVEPLPEREAMAALVGRAARALGVATTQGLATYFMLPRAATARAVDDLLDQGLLVPTSIRGRSGQYWRWHDALDAPLPARLRQRGTPVSPFDSLVFDRPRVLDLFGLDYRIEIYVPAGSRRYGYYVYPYLLGDRFAARVDLKADRATGRLLVQAAWLEPSDGATEHGRGAEQVAEHLSLALADLAAWVGCPVVEVVGRGDLAPALGEAVVSAQPEVPSDAVTGQPPHRARRTVTPVSLWQGREAVMSGKGVLNGGMPFELLPTSTAQGGLVRRVEAPALVNAPDPLLWASRGPARASGGSIALLRLALPRVASP